MGLSLLFEGEVDVIPPGAHKFFPAFGISAGGFFAPEPGIVLFRSMGFGAPVLVFEFERDCAEEPRPKDLLTTSVAPLTHMKHVETPSVCEKLTSWPCPAGSSTRINLKT
jgi:hypothetical protein